MRHAVSFALVALLPACGASTPERPARDAGTARDGGHAARDGGFEARDGGGGARDGGGATRDGGVCIPGAPACPILIDSFPFSHAGDTTGGVFELDAYDCAPSTDEGGPEIYYRVVLSEPGVLRATVDDVPGDDVDVDLHLLAGASCLRRDNVAVERWLDAGTYELVADTWVNDEGDTLAGAYVLDVTFTPAAADVCATVPTEVRMFWNACDKSVPDCIERGGERFLATPTVGPVVYEAHLVTVDEDFGGGWPTSFTDRIDRHYRVSAAASGFDLDRTEPWAPAGEGGSEFGQGSTGAPLPVLDEAWYITMYWRDRPDRGTRMLVRNPANGRAVVASAGYETGPGANTAVAGVVEEVHRYLGTGHRDDLEIGFLADQTLPLGPIDCP